ncbi:MAG TPA: hypothetical protein VGR37_22625 [Longimicrobiaceae bacterium]|nr:hypothetical protein [Longimicrobiaceae bacterium]
MRTLLLLGIPLALLHPRPGSAQAADPVLQPGARIRVLAPGAGLHDNVAATVVHTAGDTLIVDVRQSQHVLLRAEVEELQVSRGKGSRVVYGAVGAVAGTGLGFGAMRFHQNTRFNRDMHPYPTALAYGIVLGGTALGTAFGTLRPADRWEQVPLRVGASPSAELQVSWYVRGGR